MKRRLLKQAGVGQQTCFYCPELMFEPLKNVQVKKCITWNISDGDNMSL